MTGLVLSLDLADAVRDVPGDSARVLHVLVRVGLLDHESLIGGEAGQLPGEVPGPAVSLAAVGFLVEKALDLMQPEGRFVTGVHGQLLST